MVVLIFNPCIQEAKADSSLWIQAQPSLHSELQATQSHMIRLIQEKKKERKNNNKKLGNFNTQILILKKI